MSLALGALLESASVIDGGGSRHVLGGGVIGRGAFDCLVVVSWGELTSSKLQAQCYDEAGKRVPTTDYLKHHPAFGHLLQGRRQIWGSRQTRPDYRLVEASSSLRSPSSGKKANWGKQANAP